MVIIKRIWLLFYSLIFLRVLVKSYSVPDANKGLLLKVGRSMQNNVNKGVNSTGVEEMLEAVLDAALEITTILPSTFKKDDKKVENDATRKIKTIILPYNELHDNSQTVPNLASRHINTDDIIKLRKMEEYYKRALTGELREKPDPKEMEMHRSVLVKIFNQLITQNKDNISHYNVKELISTLSNITDLDTVSHSSAGVEPSGENRFKEDQLIATEITDRNVALSSSRNKTQNDNKNTIILHELPETLLKNRNNIRDILSVPVASSKPTSTLAEARSEPHLNISATERISNDNLGNFQSGLNFMNVPNSRNSFDALKYHNVQMSNSENSSGAEKLTNSTISKRYGQVSDSYSDASSYSLNLYTPQMLPNSLPSSAYITYPQLPQGIIYQSSSNPHPLTKGSQRPRGTLNQGAFQQISPHLGANKDSIPESPLAITDSVTLLGDATKSLFDILQQYNRAGSLSEYNNQLESALEALLNPQPTSDLLFVDNVNLQGLAITPKPPTRSPLSSGLDSVNGISPEILANLLIRLQLPTTDEIRNISSQITRFGTSIQDTRQGTLPASIQELLMAITTAITDIITAITMFCSMNPLVCVLLALALCALFVHIYKKHGKKKKYYHKDSGYGGGGHDHGGGYHRKMLLDHEEYRMLDSDTQLDVVIDVLGKIDVFDNWLKSLRSKDKLTSTKAK